MEYLFIEAHSGLDITLPKSGISKLPKSIGLLTTVQHVHKIGGLKKSLEKEGIKVRLIRGLRSKYPGQMLGCDVLHLRKSDVEGIDAFLYIGTGEFHPKELLLLQKKPVYIYNPSSKRFYQLKDSDISAIARKSRAAYAKFLSSEEIGVIVSAKPGQNNLESALRLRQKFPEKRFYILLFDTIDFGSLINFSFIECFVNTACPRIAYDDAESVGKPIINIDDIPQ